jgi:hypothetical protein
MERNEERNDSIGEQTVGPVYELSDEFESLTRSSKKLKFRQINHLVVMRAKNYLIGKETLKSFL